MGRTSVSKDTRTTVAAQEANYSKLLNTPSFVGLPSNQNGVTMYNTEVDANGNNFVTKSNVYYPLSNDIADESVEIASVINELGNLVPIDISGVKTQMWSNNETNVVQFPMNLKNRVKNDILTHNHPGGTALSLSDLQGAAYLNSLGFEARMNTQKFWNNMENIIRNKNDVLWNLKNMQKELRQDKLSMQLLNEINNFIGTAKYNEDRPKMVSQIRRKADKWEKLPKTRDDIDTAVSYIFERLQEDSNLSRGAASYIVSNALMMNLSSKYNFNYGVYEA